MGSDRCQMGSAVGNGSAAWAEGPQPGQTAQTPLLHLSVPSLVLKKVTECSSMGICWTKKPCQELPALSSVWPSSSCSAGAGQGSGARWLQLQPRMQRQEHTERVGSGILRDLSQVSGNLEQTFLCLSVPFCALFCFGTMGNSRLVQHIPQASTFSPWAAWGES